MNFQKRVTVLKCLRITVLEELLYSQYNLSYIYQGEAIQFLHGNLGQSCLLKVLFLYQPISLRVLEPQNGQQQARASHQLNACCSS